jgi:hypothetical protein
LFGEELHDGGQEVRIFGVDHGWVEVDVFCRTHQSGPFVVHLRRTNFRKLFTPARALTSVA